MTPVGYIAIFQCPDFADDDEQMAWDRRVAQDYPMFLRSITKVDAMVINGVRQPKPAGCNAVVVRRIGPNCRTREYVFDGRVPPCSGGAGSSN